MRLRIYRLCMAEPFLWQLFHLPKAWRGGYKALSFGLFEIVLEDVYTPPAPIYEDTH